MTLLEELLLKPQPFYDNPTNPNRKSVYPPDTRTERYCSGLCKCMRPITLFHKRGSHGKEGLQRECKNCMAERHRKSREA